MLPIKYDAYIKTTNWSTRPKFGYGVYPLSRDSESIPIVKDTWYPICQLAPAVGLKSVTVSTSEDLASGKLEFALVTGETSIQFTADKVVLAKIFADEDIATKIENKALTFGTMFTVGKPDEYVLGDLVSLMTGFDSKDWSLLNLAFKVSGADVPITFYSKFIVEGYGQTGSS